MCPERSLAAALTALGLSSSPARAQEPPIEVTIRAEPREHPTAETLGAEQARRGAGTQDDAVKALETLPGVARGGPSAEGLVVWGSESSETRVYLDGVELPWLYHGSAIRSVIPQGVLSTLTLTPGAYGAEHGRGLGGIVTLQSRHADREAARYLLHADLIDAGARVSAPLGPRAGAVIAGRYGYLERWLPNFTDRDGERLYTIPSYYDGYARAALELDGERELALQALASHDRATRSVPSTDPETRVAEVLDRDFQRISLHYRGSGATALAFAGKDSEERAATTLDGGWSLSLTSTLYGLRAQKRETLSDLVSLEFGVDALGKLTRVERAGTLTLPAREGDAVAFGQPPGPDVARDSFDAHLVNVAPYAELALELGALRVAPGLRLNSFLIESERLRPPSGRVPSVGSSSAYAPLEARGHVELAASEQVSWELAFGRYHQAPSPADLSAVFGNPTLGLSSATHLALGENIRFGRGLELELLGFAKWLADLPVRNAATSPPTARALVSTGVGRVYGTEVSLRQSLVDGWSGWLAWTISRGERRRAPGEAFRPFDFDQPHVVSASVNKRSRDWAFGALVRYASGSPRTPVVDAFYNVSLGHHEPVFGDVNSARLPAAFELDLRVDRRLAELGGAALWLYIDALNVTLQENAEALVYSADYRNHDYLTGPPALVDVGLRLER